jgi:hypothetical protein
MDEYTIINEFEVYCKEMIIPFMKEDAEDGRWKGIISSCFKTEKCNDHFIIFVDYTVGNDLMLQLSLCGVLEGNNSFNIFCKCNFNNNASAEGIHKQIELKTENIKEMCIKEFQKAGFGVSTGSHELRVWASLSEPDGQYIVSDIEDPYDLFSTFIDIVDKILLTLTPTLSSNLN